MEANKPRNPAPQTTPDRYALIPIAAITIGDQMIRHDPYDDDITELAMSIASAGLLQPIGVTDCHDGTFQLRWGSRRIAAHHRLARTTIQAAIYDTDDCDVVAIALMENSQRRQMTISEECDAVARCGTRGLSTMQIAAFLGKSKHWVQRRQAFPGLPPDIRDLVLDGRMPIATAEALSLLTDLGMRAYAINYVQQNQLTAREARSLAESLLNTPSMTDAITAGVNAPDVATAPPLVQLQCAACKQYRPVSHLVIVHICNDGCNPTTRPADTTH